MDRTVIARVAHEINRAYCASLGDASQPAWEDAPEWQKASALAGVDMHLANPDATPEQSHESWLAQKTAEGWKYGPVKDAEKKELPCFLPYADLPAEQKAKDYLFRGTVHALKAIEPEKVIVEVQVPGPAVALATKAEAIPPGHVLVKYIGRRPTWEDSLYSSGLTFSTDQVRPLPGELASKLLRHPDVFAEITPDEAAPDALPQVVEPARDDTAELLEAAKQREAEEMEKESRLQDLRQQVTFMEKDALKDFATRNYRQKLDGRLSVEAMRTQVLQLIDQFGTV